MKKICICLILFFLVGCTSSKVENSLVANQNSFIDHNSDKVVINGHEYNYDTTSGATVLPSRSADGKEYVPMNLEEKEKIMYWTATPPMGLIEGEYYFINHKFGHFNDKYDALIDLVINDGKIVHVEMDEKLSPTYYNKTWANQKKRRTGYTFFQFSKPRTDTTKVTWANGVTFLEYQILKYNSLNLDFSTVYGSTNSARDGFIPAVALLKEQIKKPSGQYYIGYTKETSEGLLARLQLVFENDKIVKASYDEIFPDTKEAIKNESLKKYYRQSKYDSIDYQKDFGNQFNKFSDSLVAKIIETNSIEFDADFKDKEYATFKDIAKDLKDVIAKMPKAPYSHNIGKIDQKPENMVIDENNISRQQDIEMKLLKSEYDDTKQILTLDVEVTNKSDKVYKFKTGSFYMYVMNTQGIYDTVADPDSKQLEVAANDKLVVTLKVKPIYKTDTDMSLKYDGLNKVYHSMNVSK